MIATEGAAAQRPVADRLEVRLARNAAEIDAAQRLRYTVFYEEWGARAAWPMVGRERDVDEYDRLVDHLVVIDHARTPAEGQVVGNYRLLRRERLGPDGRFYSSAEFEIDMLLDSGLTLLELGRSCVLREYRSLRVLQLLWRAIASYVADHGIQVMFGCASMRGTDPDVLREQLAYLHHYHRAPLPMRPRALGPTRISMDVMDKASIDPMRATRSLEPIIKGYLRLGAHVGEGAYIDHQFNSVDVCVVVPTARLTRKYLRHYERVIDRELVVAGGGDEAGGPRIAATA